MINWSYNGGTVDNNANDHIGSNGDNGVYGENNSIGDIGNVETNSFSGVIGTTDAIRIIDTNGVNYAKELPLAPLYRQCC